MPELGNPVQKPQTIIEIRPFKGGWQCYEGPGVQPYWTGDNANRVLSTTLKRMRNSDTVRFAC